MIDALDSLNSMLSVWNNKKLLGPNLVRAGKVISAGDGDYTIGTGANINVDRPVRVDYAFLRDGSFSDETLLQIGRSEYSDISVKTEQGRPTCFFYDATLPTGTIYLHPIPDQEYTLLLDLFYRFPSYDNPADSFALQDGMEDAVVYNLAIRLAPEYGKQVPPDVRQIASEALRAVKMTNSLDIPIVTTWYKSNFSIEAG